MLGSLILAFPVALLTGDVGLSMAIMIIGFIVGTIAYNLNDWGWMCSLW